MTLRGSLAKRRRSCYAKSRVNIWIVRLTFHSVDIPLGSKQVLVQAAGVHLSLQSRELRKSAPSSNTTFPILSATAG